MLIEKKQEMFFPFLLLYENEGIYHKAYMTLAGK